MTESSPLFVAEHLHKRFGDQVVLEDINLSFNAGSISGIMGPNGAGKSTCFNVLTGMYRPDGGSVFFDGEDVTGLAPERIVEKGISRSFQIMNLFDEFTALENIMVATNRVRHALHRPFWDLRADSEISQKAADVLAMVGLKGQENSLASDMSYGQRRALEIAVSLATEPRIVFLDEPTQGLGADGRANLADLIGTLQEKFTLVIIEHDMQFLFRLANRISVIHWGQIIAEGTPDELQANEWVRTSELGKMTTC